MIRLLKKIPVSGIFILIICGACRLVPDKIEVPKWKVELLGPVLHADVKLHNLNEVRKLKLYKAITAQDLELELGDFVNPDSKKIKDLKFHLSIGKEIKELFNVFGDGKVVLINNFPFMFEKGISIELRNPGNREIIFSMSTSAPFIPGDSLVFTMPFNKLNLLNDLELYVKGITIPKVLSPVYLDLSSNLGYTFVMDVNEVGQVAVSSLSNFTSSNISELSIDADSLKGPDINGYINFFVNNSFPLGVTFQVKFLDKDKNELDSLFFKEAIIKEGVFDDAGNTISQGESKITFRLDIDRLRKIEKTKFAKIEFLLCSPHSSVDIILQNDYKLNLKMVADIQTPI